MSEAGPALARARVADFLGANGFRVSVARDGCELDRALAVGSIILSHGGSIELMDRRPQGLRARITLPEASGAT